MRVFLPHGGRTCEYQRLLNLVSHSFLKLSPRTVHGGFLQDEYERFESLSTLTFMKQVMLYDFSNHLRC